MKFKPFPYQTEGVNRIEKMEYRSLLADDMGLGKSAQALMAMLRLKAERTLVVCPASVKWNWQNECKKHFNVRAEVISGTKVPHHLPNAPVLIINYDILKHWKAETPWCQKLSEWGPELLIYDECHYLQSKAASRTKAARILAKDIPHIIALSGTPMTNRPVEMWPILNILQPTVFPNYWSFCHRYGNPKRKPWGWDFSGASNVKELNKLLEKVMIRRRREDVLSDLPTMSRVVTPLDISDRKQYETAKNNFLQWIRNHKPDKVGASLRAEGLMKANYLKQLTSELKLKAVTNWIDDFLSGSDEKLLLFAIHKQIVSHLEERYKKICTKVTGSVIGKQRQEAFDKFRNNKSCRILIGNIRAAGVGWNAEFCRHAAFCELEWAPGLHSQAERRCLRLDSKNAVTAHYLLARDTIETKLAKILQKKQETLGEVLDGQVVDEMDMYSQLVNEMLL